MKTKNVDSNLTQEPIASGWNTKVAPEFCEVGMLFPLLGIRRTMAFQGIREGWFKSVLIRKKGNRSGKRLVHIESARAWLHQQMEAQGK